MQCFSCVSLKLFSSLVFMNSVIWKLCWSSLICLWILLRAMWLFWFANLVCYRALLSSFAWKLNCWTWWLMTSSWIKKSFRKSQLKCWTQLGQVFSWWCLICMNDDNVLRPTASDSEDLFIDMFLKYQFLKVDFLSLSGWFVYWESFCIMTLCDDTWLSLTLSSFRWQWFM